MMKNIKKILLLTFLSIGLVACDDNRAADQEVEATGSHAQKAVVTLTSTDASGDINEGSVIDFTVNFDKPLSSSVNFVAVVKGGTAGASDVILGSTQVAAYATSSTLSVTIAADLIPELDETVIITVEAASPASGYFVHSSSNFGEYTYNIISPVDPDDLIVALEWDTHEAVDVDMFSYSALGGAWDQQWTGDHPEVKNLIWGVDPDGTYHLGIDPYEVNVGVTEFWYRWSLGQPDGTVTVIEGTFDYENRDTVYTIDPAASPSYRLVTVEKTGTTFVATGVQ